MNHELGIRSRLVLEKLGFDLRPCFADTLDAPIPPRLQDLADQLAGYAEWRDVGEMPAEREEERHEHAARRDASLSDGPFCFG